MEKLFKDKALVLLKEKKVSELVFSEGTYQVKVIDGKEEFWPLLQLDDEGKIKDTLCGCDSEEEGCCHAYAAYLKVTKDKEPLHVRFRTSFFNQLFQVVAQRHGFDHSFLKKKEGIYQTFSKTKKKLIEINPIDERTKKFLKGLIENRKEETEENSLKFSNLSLEEMAAYKDGKPSFRLAYELSFLKDLAKWLFLQKEEGAEFTVNFKEDEKNLPTKISVESSFLKLFFYIAETYLPDIISSLNTINSNLQLFEPKEDLIEKIIYDPKEKALFVFGKKKKEEEIKIPEAKEIGPWIYKGGVGFYPKRPEPLLERPKISFSKLSETLSEFAPQIHKHLEGEKLSLEPVSVKYHLFFDKEKKLYITPYFFKISDMEEKGAFYSHPWVYLPSKGFFPIAEPFFEERLIESNNVSDFIDRHKGFLSDFSGFEVHTSTLETKIVYAMDEQNNLHFSAKLSLGEAFGEVNDFGKYVYVSGEGFYQKKEKSPSFLAGKDLVIQPKEISSFIKEHINDLNSVDGFFTERSPIEKMALEVRLKEGNKIELIPVIEYYPSFSPKNVFSFDPYLFVKDHGFYILPPSMQLPQKYKEKKVLSEEEKAFFLNYELDSIRPSISYIDRRLRRADSLQLEISSISKVSRGWQVVLTYVSEIGRENAYTVYSALQEGRKFFFSNAGLIYLSDLRFSWLRRVEKSQLVNERFVFSTLQWIYLCLFEKIIPPEGEGKKYFDELMEFKCDEAIDLSLLQSELRSYQLMGVNWLWFLYCHDLSGLLCDDMGLGKTHQAMALLSAVLKKDESRKNKYIVVCPTSVLYHWEKLLHQFLPNIKVLLYYGSLRSLEDLDNYDLLLTSYGIVRSEKEKISDTFFELAIFDEIQIAKTSSSITHQALLKIRSRMVLGLTGTPLENRLFELKALFDVVLPSYLPSDSLFHREFSIPIEKNGDKEKKQLLSSLIKPFILRRNKKDVLKELPEKTEEIAYCDLSSEQEKIYENTLIEHRTSLLEELENRDKSIPYMHIFSLFSKLKQICNHVSLVTKDIKNYEKYPSGKWDLFCELVNEAIESDQKVVVFTQYLDMITIMENYFKSQKIGYSLIKGSTKDRKEQIESFYQDPDKKVFIGSLLAAGVGIELSCASVVIHYDRWWNPAKENQATDRVHRIGQTRGVQVFKFVCKNTIEEHIHDMIERKKRLFEETVTQDDIDQIKVLSREELISVLKRTKTFL